MFLVWVINKSIAYKGILYIRDLTVINLIHHWLKLWPVVWQHQVITLSDKDLLSVGMHKRNYSVIKIPITWFPIVFMSQYINAMPYDNGLGSLLRHGLILIPTWISNHMPDEIWDAITYPFPNLNGAAVDVLEWISNFIPHLIVDVMLIHAGIKVYPC